MRWTQRVPKWRRGEDGRARDICRQIENVLIRAGECTVTMLPRFGGKIASIRIGELELLQQPIAPIAPRTRTMAFDAR